MFTSDQLVNGDDLLLYVYTNSGMTASSPIAFGTSAELSIEGETQEAAHKLSCRWSDAIAGKNSYSISCDALYTQASGLTSFDTLMDKMIKEHPDNIIYWALGMAEAAGSGETCETRTYGLDTDKTYYSGKGIITSLSLSAGNGEVASCSINIQGTGEVTPHFAS